MLIGANTSIFEYCTRFTVQIVVYCLLALAVECRRVENMTFVQLTAIRTPTQFGKLNSENSLMIVEYYEFMIRMLIQKKVFYNKILIVYRLETRGVVERPRMWRQTGTTGTSIISCALHVHFRCTYLYSTIVQRKRNPEEWLKDRLPSRSTVQIF